MAANNQGSWYVDTDGDYDVDITTPYGWGLGGSALHADRVVTAPAADVSSLKDSDLQPIISEALARWAAAGLNATDLNKLTQVQFVVTDIRGSYLGEAMGNRIYLDVNAAGNGWFVDSTPAANEEFAASSGRGQLQAVDPRAVDRIDLLTVVEHELGHIAGLDDLDALADSLMSGVLGVGVRRDLYLDYVEPALAVS